MNSGSRKKDLSNDMEFLADFQLLLGNIFRINGALLEVSEKVCGKDKLITVPIWRVTAVIRQQPMTVSAIASYLGLKRQSVQATVNQMKKKGLVALKQNPHHKKSFLITLTSKGHKTLERIFSYQKELTKIFVNDIDVSITDLIKTTEFIRALRENSIKNIDISIH